MRIDFLILTAYEPDQDLEFDHGTEPAYDFDCELMSALRKPIFGRDCD